MRRVRSSGRNLSVLDGWWAEAYDGLNGFAIGLGETHSSADVHDQRDAASLLRVLQDHVIPLDDERARDASRAPTSPPPAARAVTAVAADE